MKYIVHFDKVHEVFIEVDANDEYNAVRQAIKRWEKDAPLVLDVRGTEAVDTQENPA